MQWADWGAAATADTISILRFSTGLAATDQYETGLTDPLGYALNSGAGLRAVVCCM